MIGAAIPWAVEALLASAVLMAIVLMVRAPVRRMFGAQVAYALWALPALRLMLPPLPEGWREAATPIARAGETITLIVLPGVAAPVAEITTSEVSLGAVVAIAWGVGAALFLGAHFLRHTRFCRRILSRGETIDRVERVRIIASEAAAGPLAFGVLRPCVAFPRDFAERYDADERALALAHELGHHARGDLIANWAALVVLALHWFNPIAWRAFHAFRADQECANDARVLAGRSRYERHAYACAIVKAAHGGRVSAACHLHSVRDLKGRLTMLTTSPSSRRRLAAGGVSVAALVAVGLGLTASGGRAADRARASVERATGVDFSALAPVASHQHAPEAMAAGSSRESRDRVMVVKDGKATTYEGDAAVAYIAAHPVSLPPTPPVPPMPDVPDATDVGPIAPPPPALPTPPVRAISAAHAVALADAANVRAIRAVRDIPDIVSRGCDGTGRLSGDAMVVTTTRDGRKWIVICTDRIERQARRGAEMAADAGRIQREAMRHALAGLRQARASMANDRRMFEEARREALAAMDEALVELERDAAEYD